MPSSPTPIHPHNQAAAAANENTSFPPADLFLFFSCLFFFLGAGSTNHRRPSRTPDPVSGWPQPIRCAPAHLTLGGPLARRSQAFFFFGVELPHRCSGAPPSFPPRRQPIGCIAALSHVSWRIFRILHFLFSARARAHPSERLCFSVSHHALRAYQRASS